MTIAELIFTHQEQLDYLKAERRKMIKAYREEHDVGLKEAKEAVDNTPILEEQLGR